MRDRTILGIGVVGAVVAAICCFTSTLVVVLGVVGLSAWLGWIDYALLPALVVFLGIAAYGLFLVRRNAAQRKTSGATEEPG